MDVGDEVEDDAGDPEPDDDGHDAEAEAEDVETATRSKKKRVRARKRSKKGGSEKNSEGPDQADVDQETTQKNKKKKHTSAQSDDEIALMAAQQELYSSNKSVHLRGPEFGELRLKDVAHSNGFRLDVFLFGGDEIKVHSVYNHYEPVLEDQDKETEVLNEGIVEHGTLCKMVLAGNSCNQFREGKCTRRYCTRYHARSGQLVTCTSGYGDFTERILKIKLSNKMTRLLENWQAQEVKDKGKRAIQTARKNVNAANAATVKSFSTQKKRGRINAASTLSPSSHPNMGMNDGEDHFQLEPSRGSGTGGITPERRAQIAMREYMPAAASDPAPRRLGPNDQEAKRFTQWPRTHGWGKRDSGTRQQLSDRLAHLPRVGSMGAYTGYPINAADPALAHITEAITIRVERDMHKLALVAEWFTMSCEQCHDKIKRTFWCPRCYSHLYCSEECWKYSAHRLHSCILHFVFTHDAEMLNVYELFEQRPMEQLDLHVEPLAQRRSSTSCSSSAANELCRTEQKQQEERKATAASAEREAEAASANPISDASPDHNVDPDAGAQQDSSYDQGLDPRMALQAPAPGFGPGQNQQQQRNQHVPRPPPRPPPHMGGYGGMPPYYPAPYGPQGQPYGPPGPWASPYHHPNYGMPPPDHRFGEGGYAQRNERPRQQQRNHPRARYQPDNQPSWDEQDGDGDYSA